MNIPIYRGKKIDSEEFVEGYYSDTFHLCLGSEQEHIICSKFEDNFVQQIVDPKTLSIHFPNMLDKNGKKIFASLSEDGVGGDIAYSTMYKENVKFEFLVYCLNIKTVKNERWLRNNLVSSDIEVIGIHNA